MTAVLQVDDDAAAGGEVRRLGRRWGEMHVKGQDIVGQGGGRGDGEKETYRMFQR